MLFPNAQNLENGIGKWKIAESKLTPINIVLNSKSFISKNPAPSKLNREFKTSKRDQKDVSYCLIRTSLRKNP